MTVTFKNAASREAVYSTIGCILIGLTIIGLLAWALVGIGYGQTPPRPRAQSKPTAEVKTEPEAKAVSQPGAPIAIAPLTPEESEKIRVAQIEFRDANAAYTQLEEDTKRRLIQTPEFYAKQATLQHLTATMGGIFDSRKLVNGKDAVLCDGNGPGQAAACADVKDHKLALKALPAPPPVEEKK